ncbi:MAG: rhodanese-like domain-containing protein [Balneolaceae bacterium]
MKKKHTPLIVTTFLTLILLMAAALFSNKKSGDMDPQAFKKELENRSGVVIDVRTPGEYETGHLAETDYLIDFLSDDFDEEINKLDKEKTYYLYCRSGNRSGKAMKKMLDAGFQEVYNVGGYEELVAAGIPSKR